MIALALLMVLGSCAAYWSVAFASDTTWWWWFVPFYGTVKIFMSSVGLGLLQLVLGWAYFLGHSLGRHAIAESA
jgi:hypothetical protein